MRWRSVGRGCRFTASRRDDVVQSRLCVFDTVRFVLLAERRNEMSCIRGLRSQDKAFAKTRSRLEKEVNSWLQTITDVTLHLYKKTVHSIFRTARIPLDEVAATSRGRVLRLLPLCRRLAASLLVGSLLHLLLDLVNLVNFDHVEEGLEVYGEEHCRDNRFGEHGKEVERGLGSRGVHVGRGGGFVDDEFVDGRASEEGTGDDEEEGLRNWKVGANG